MSDAVKNGIRHFVFIGYFMKIKVVSLELNKKYEIEISSESSIIYDISIAEKIFCAELGKNNVECVGMLCLDFNNQIINYSNLAIGTIENVKVSLSQICKIALLSNASRVIVAHNHPDGCLKITDEDISMTRNISSALKMFNVKLLDSIIVNDNGESVSIRHAIKEMPNNE